MARPHNIPEGAEIIRTYEELKWFLKAYAEGFFTLLIVVGPPGTSKSASSKEALKGKAVCYIQGHARPIQVYIRLYEKRNEPVIIDDAEGLYEDSAGRNLLTTMTQTEKVKHPEWLSSSKILADLGVPMRYSTTSSVCIITNRWSGTSKEIQALEDRGHLIYFDPKPEEVHRYVGAWLQRDAQDVYDFIGKHLHRIERPSCRLYVKAIERKAAGGDWREYILHHCHRVEMQIVQEIIDDPSYTCSKDRVKAAKAKAGISRATYFRLKKKIEEDGQRRPIKPYKLEKTKLISEPPAVMDDQEEGNGQEVDDPEEDNGQEVAAEGGAMVVRFAEFRET